MRNQPPRPRHALVCELVRAFLARGVPVTAEGVLEIGSDPFGFLRWPEFNFLPCPEDLYVPAPWCGSTGCARATASPERCGRRATRKNSWRSTG